MNEAQSFELLKKKRKSLRTAITKAVNELDTELSNPELNTDNLDELVEILSMKFEHLTVVDQQIEPFFKPEEFDGEFETTEEYREKVRLSQFRAKRKISRHSEQPSVSPSSQTSTSPPHRTEHFLNSDNIRIKVPKYHIARFYGDDVSKWLTFWNSFETAVHNNEALTKVDKFHYLKAHLGGTALNTVEGFAISAEAYDEAVELLKNRFACPEILIQAHMNKILSLQPLRNSSDLRSFRKFVDNCNVQLRSLESLGVSSTHYGRILCPMILKLIPPDLVFDYNKSQQKDSGSDIQQLLLFLTQNLVARERSYSINRSTFEMNNRRQEAKPQFSRERGVNKKQNQNSIPTANELITAPVREYTDNKKNTCLFCVSTSHGSNECKVVFSLSLEGRKNKLLRNKACFNCLKINCSHIARNCPMSKTRCTFCSGLHHHFFCFQRQKTEPKEIETVSTDLTNQSRSEVFLQTLVIYIENGKSKQLVRAILDTGSQKSYISKFVAKHLGLKSIGKETITHGLFGGHRMTEVHNKYSIKLSSYDGTYNCIMEVNDENNICFGISRIEDYRILQKLTELNVFLSDSSVNNKLCLFEKDADEIHILLGSDIVGKLFTGEIKQLSDGLTAINTCLGWTVMGKLNYESNFNTGNSLLVHSLLTNQTKISDLWELDLLGIKDPSEKKSKLELQDLALKHFENTVARDEEGRYVVCIPWIEGNVNIGNQLNLAEKRLKNTVRSLNFVGRLSDYEQVFAEWEKEGIIKRVVLDEPSKMEKLHFLPHRPVYKENSTTKIRPVFDGSARHGKFCSLNDCLEKGPNLIEMIPAILNRFRLGKIGVVSDIRKAFLQISLHENDTNFLCFLWWEGGNPENMVIYRHCRVVFGISCSPFLLAAVLNYHFKQAPEHLENVAEKLKEAMYVDNCVSSVESIEELKSFQRDSKELLALGKFDLRGWRHSDLGGPNFEDGINQEEPYSLEVPVLGILWNVKEDTLSISYREDETREEFITKRKILSLAHRIFDPIGVTCPITLIPKLLLQECWRTETSWDSRLPVDIEKKCGNWKKQLVDLKDVKIPRRLSSFNIKDIDISFQVFCDASKLSYAACVFLRAERNGEVTCQLIQARSKVAPLKGTSIPRLELLSCVIGVRLADSIKKDLHMEDIPATYWSDSMDVLHWIRREGPWATFVANRVEEIRRLSDKESWRHVPGFQNPADLPSRGCSVKTLLRERWWEGPSWIKGPAEDWPKSEQFPNMEVVNSERKKTIVTAADIGCEEKYYQKYSSYVRMVRITAWITRFLTNMKTVKDQRIMGPLKPDEIKKAERVLLKQVQMDVFSNVDDKRLSSLQVIKDAEGILRLKTKVFLRDDHEDFRLPIILPSSHPVVKALISYEHVHLGHSGVQMLMCKLRENYWILKSRKSIKEVIKSCIICNRFNVKPISVSEGLLPQDRVREAAIFEIIGLDLAGPLILKDRRKAWILVLTCAVYRAIHLELLTDLSTESFLLGLRRFIARRGRPSVIYSDNGSNFRGAYRLLMKVDLEKLKNIEDLNPISWKFIPPHAPWWGGFWERLVGLVKRILRKTLGRTSLNEEELYTVLCDCESLVNSRPLTYVSDDVGDLEPLTPAMFIQDIREVGVPELDQIDENKLKKKLAYRNRVQKDLRKRFRIEYLGQLREMKRVKKEIALSEGDIVLVEDDTKRLNWNLGKSLELHSGKDSRVRVALVKTRSGSFLRPVQKLYPLEMKDKNKLSIDNTNSLLFSGANEGDFLSIRATSDPNTSILTCSRHPEK